MNVSNKIKWYCKMMAKINNDNKKLAEENKKNKKES